jgi:hypothetical protein
MHGLEELRVKESDRSRRSLAAGGERGQLPRRRGEPLRRGRAGARRRGASRPISIIGIAYELSRQGLAAEQPVAVDDTAMIATSFPSFVALLTDLGADFTEARQRREARGPGDCQRRPAASGKGTLARRIADHFGLRHLDTGLTYRAVADALLRDGADLGDEAAAIRAAERWTSRISISTGSRRTRSARRLLGSPSSRPCAGPWWRASGLRAVAARRGARRP